MNVGWGDGCAIGLSGWSMGIPTGGEDAARTAGLETGATRPLIAVGLR